MNGNILRNSFIVTLIVIPLMVVVGLIVLSYTSSSVALGPLNLFLGLVVYVFPYTGGVTVLLLIALVLRNRPNNILRPLYAVLVANSACLFIRVVYSIHEYGFGPRAQDFIIRALIMLLASVVCMLVFRTWRDKNVQKV